MSTDFEISNEEDNENSGIESDGMGYLEDKSDDVNNGNYLNEYVLKTIKNKSYYINDCVLITHQLEIVFNSIIRDSIIIMSSSVSVLSLSSSSSSLSSYHIFSFCSNDSTDEYYVFS